MVMSVHTVLTRPLTCEQTMPGPQGQPYLRYYPREGGATADDDGYRDLLGGRQRLGSFDTGYMPYVLPKELFSEARAALVLRARKGKSGKALMATSASIEPSMEELYARGFTTKMKAAENATFSVAEFADAWKVYWDGSPKTRPFSSWDAIGNLLALYAPSAVVPVACSRAGTSLGSFSASVDPCSPAALPAINLAAPSAEASCVDSPPSAEAAVRAAVEPASWSELGRSLRVPCDAYVAKYAAAMARGYCFSVFHFGAPLGQMMAGCTRDDVTLGGLSAQALSSLLERATTQRSCSAPGKVLKSKAQLRSKRRAVYGDAPKSDPTRDAFYAGAMVAVPPNELTADAIASRSAAARSGGARSAGVLLGGADKHVANWPAYARIPCPFESVHLFVYAEAADAPLLGTLLRSVRAQLPCYKELTVVTAEAADATFLAATAVPLGMKVTYRLEPKAKDDASLSRWLKRAPQPRAARGRASLLWWDRYSTADVIAVLSLDAVLSLPVTCQALFSSDGKPYLFYAPQGTAGYAAEEQLLSVLGPLLGGTGRVAGGFGGLSPLLLLPRESFALVRGVLATSPQASTVQSEYVRRLGALPASLGDPTATLFGNAIAANGEGLAALSPCPAASSLPPPVPASLIAALDSLPACATQAFAAVAPARPSLSSVTADSGVPSLAVTLSASGATCGESGGGSGGGGSDGGRAVAVACPAYAAAAATMAKQAFCLREAFFPTARLLYTDAEAEVLGPIRSFDGSSTRARSAADPIRARQLTLAGCFGPGMPGGVPLESVSTSAMLPPSLFAYAARSPTDLQSAGNAAHNALARFATRGMPVTLGSCSAPHAQPSRGGAARAPPPPPGETNFWLEDHAIHFKNYVTKGELPFKKYKLRKNVAPGETDAVKEYLQQARAEGRTPQLGLYNQPMDPSLTKEQIERMARQTGLPQEAFVAKAQAPVTGDMQMAIRNMGAAQAAAGVKLGNMPGRPRFFGR